MNLQNSQPDQQSKMNPNQQQINQSFNPSNQPADSVALDKQNKHENINEGQKDENFEKQAHSENPMPNSKEYVNKDGKNANESSERAQ